MKHTREYILSEIKKILHAVAPDAQAILFGSRARDDAREDSCKGNIAVCHVETDLSWNRMLTSVEKVEQV